MKTISITEHKDGTYTLNHLTFEEIHYLQSALTKNWQSLTEQKAKTGKLNEWAEASKDFSDDISQQLLSIITGD